MYQSHNYCLQLHGHFAFGIRYKTALYAMLNSLMNYNYRQ